MAVIKIIDLLKQKMEEIKLLKDEKERLIKNVKTDISIKQSIDEILNSIRRNNNLFIDH